MFSFSRPGRYLPGVLIALGTSALILLSGYVSNVILTERVVTREQEKKSEALLQDTEAIQGRIRARVSDLFFLKAFAERELSDIDLFDPAANARLRTMTESLLRSSPNLLGVAATDEAGQPLFSAGVPLPFSESEKAEALSTVVGMEPETASFFPVLQLSSNDGKPPHALAMILGCRIQTHNPHQDGVLFLVCDLGEMLRDISTHGAVGKKSIFAMEGSWILTPAENGTGGWRVQSQAEEGDWPTSLLSQIPHSVETYAIRNNGDLFCFRRIRSPEKIDPRIATFHSGRMDWIVASKVPASTLLKEVRQQQAGVWLVTTVALILFLPVSLAAAIWFRNLVHVSRQLDRVFTSSMHGLIALQSVPTTHNAPAGIRVLRSNRVANQLLKEDGHLLPEIHAWVLEAMRTETAQVREFQIAQPSGLHWYLTRIAPMTEGAVLSFADITQRKNDEAALRASETSLKLAVHISKVGFWSLDHPGRKVYWSPEVRKIYGLPPDFDPRLTSALSFYPPTARKQVIHALLQCETGEPFELETEFRDAEGKIKWVRVIGEPEMDAESGVLRRIVGTIQDVTEIRNSSLALAESRQQLSLAFWGGGMSRSDWRIATGEIVFDEVWQVTLGYGVGEVHPTIEFWNSLIPEEDLAEIEAARQRYFDGETDFFEAEYRMRAKNGDYHWALERGRITEVDDKGRPLRMAGILIDITGRKHMEERLSEALRKEQDLLRATRTAEQAKRNFLAVMSHEIRTPMNSILGFAEILAHAPLGPEELDCAQTIRESGESLLRILDDILDYSRIESGRLQIEKSIFITRNLLESVRELFVKAADAKGLQLQVVVEDTVPAQLFGDPGRLRQILVNLVGNALKFTTAGSVTLTVDRAFEANPIARIRFRVSDTGVGIPPNKLSTIFEPFTQADATISRSHGGAGLGLAISNLLVKQLGGTLTASSNPGQGSVFSFTLPFGQRASQPAATSPTPPPAPHVGFASECPLRILIAEDDRVNARLMRLVLEKLGYQSVHAEDGQVALSAVRNSRPDLIFMDLHMPKMDGIQTTRSLRAMELTGALPRPPIWICAFTADVLPEEKKACENAGMNDYLTKPLAIEKLCQALRRAYESLQKTS